MPISTPSTDLLSGTASRHGIHVAAGLDDHLDVAAVLIGTGGDLLLHFRINELPISLDSYPVGNELGAHQAYLSIEGAAASGTYLPNAAGGPARRETHCKQSFGVVASAAGIRMEATDRVHRVRPVDH